MPVDKHNECLLISNGKQLENMQICINCQWTCSPTVTRWIDSLLGGFKLSSDILDSDLAFSTELPRRELLLRVLRVAVLEGSAEQVEGSFPF